ncbi:MAG: hypothetical protein V3V24_09635 [Nitrospinaceae bacterium]
MLVTTLLLAALLMPADAHAGFFDFIGEAATAVSDATWKVYLIKAIERTLPSLILLTCIVGAILSYFGAAKLGMRLHETARTALRDGEVSTAEWSILGTLTVVTLPIVLMLLWFGYFLMTAAQSGLSELMK